MRVKTARARMSSRRWKARSISTSCVRRSAGGVLNTYRRLSAPLQVRSCELGPVSFSTGSQHSSALCCADESLPDERQDRNCARVVLARFDGPGFRQGIRRTSALKALSSALKVWHSSGTPSRRISPYSRNASSASAPAAQAARILRSVHSAA